MKADLAEKTAQLQKLQGDAGGAAEAQKQITAERDTLRAAIEELPDRYRVPIVLRYYADLDYGEVAETLGVSRGQVATLLFRARQRLRQGLAPERGAR